MLIYNFNFLNKILNSKADLIKIKVSEDLSVDLIRVSR